MSATLDAFLARYPPEYRPIVPPVPLENAGGLSGASLWKVWTPRGPFAARAWPIDGPSPPTLDAIHAWLREAGPLGTIPVPVATTDGRTFCRHDGRLWELAPWMPGSAEVRRPPPEDRVRIAFTGLARFHVRLAKFTRRGMSPGLQSRLGEIKSLLTSGFEELDDALQRTSPDSNRELAVRWLDLARRLAPIEAAALSRSAGVEVPLQPCWRDARPDHFLFDGGRLSGMVDFGAMGMEVVSADLSRLLAEWIGADRALRDAAIDAYIQIRPLSIAELGLMPAFGRSAALLGGGHWARWHFLDHRTFDDPSAVLEGLRKGVDRIAELAADYGGSRWSCTQAGMSKP